MSAKFRLVTRRLLVAGLAFAAGGGSASSVFAQEAPQYAPPAIHVEVAAGEGGDVIGVVQDAPVLASPVITATAAGDGAIYFAQPWGEDASSLVNWGNVQDELELLDDQREKIRNAQREMQEQMQKHFAEMREAHQRRLRELQDRGDDGKVPAPRGGNAGGGNPGGDFAPRIIAPPPDFQKTQEVMKQLREELAEKVDDVLLPHQRKRLEEISFRMKMKHRGTSGALVDSQLAKALDIDDAQKERIQRRAAEVQKELEEKIARLREEAREEILEELSPSQRRKLDDLLGKEFDDRPRIVSAPPPVVRKVERKVERKAERKVESSGDDDSGDDDSGDAGARGPERR